MPYKLETKEDLFELLRKLPEKICIKCQEKETVNGEATCNKCKEEFKKDRAEGKPYLESLGNDLRRMKWQGKDGWK